MAKYDRRRPYISRREKLQQHYSTFRLWGWVILLILVVWAFLKFEDIWAWLKTFTY